MNPPIRGGRPAWRNRPAPPEPVKQSEPRGEAVSAIATIGFYFALVFIFLRFSLLPEVVTYKLGVNIRLSLLFGAPALLILLITGGIRRSLQDKASWMFIGYLVWLLAAAPFSVWRGGTFDTLKGAFLTEFSMFFIVTGLVYTLKQVQRINAAIALGGIVNLVVCRLFGTYETGRLSLAFGTLQNPNDLAVHLILILPFFILMFYTAGRLWLVLSIPAVIASMYMVLLSGSRMALVTLGLMSVFIFIRSSMLQRAVMVGMFVVVSLVSLILLPAATLQRYMTIFSSQPVDIVDMNEYQSAVGSTDARMRLLRNSIQLTFENPLFGVGPGQFAVEEAALQKAMGRRGSWQVTHNTYTQVSSEAGLPALFFYTTAILFTLLGLRRVMKRRVRYNQQTELLGSVAFCIQLSIVGLAVCSFFGALAYQHYLPTLLGLAIVFTQIARQQLEQFSLAQAQPAKPSPATNTPRALPFLR